MKVIVLGLDGATFNLIKPWAEQGKLPNFSKLMKEGVSQTLKSILPPVTCICWPSIYTGKNPGEHGIFEWGHVDRKTSEMTKIFSPLDVKADFLWEALQKKGYRCGVVNIPFSSPFRKKPEFAEGDHLRKEWINFDWKDKNTNAGITPDNKYFDKRIIGLIRMRMEQLVWIIKNKQFDFLALNIYVLDPLEHFRWDNQDLLLKAYKIIDKGLSDVLKSLKKEDYFFIISDHGMRKLDGWFYINNWLENEGYIKLKKPVVTPKKSSFSILQRSLKGAINPLIAFIHKAGLYKFIPSVVRRGFSKMFSRLHSKNLGDIPFNKFKKNIDWSRSKAYAISMHGKIYVNDKSAINEIKQKLKEFSENKKWKIKIYEKEELYKGKYLNNSPDLILEINNGRIQTKSSLNTKNQVLVKSDRSQQQAQHDLNGIYICNKKIKLDKANVLEIFPTILDIFDKKVNKK